MSVLLDKITTKINKFKCDRALRKVAMTVPASFSSPHNVVILSMVGKRVIYDYLVAIKSFLLYIGVKEVHVLSDGTLDDEDTCILSEHVPGIVIHHADELDMSELPRGNCWERLAMLLTLAKDNYVIQLDADIVINGELHEVSQAIGDNRGFILGNEKWKKPVSMQEMANIAKQWDSCHIQGFSEKHFDRLPLFNESDCHYFRGCAAFIGLPASEHYLPILRKFSAQMENEIGDKWNLWGSEQVSSNVICSLSPGMSMLSWPKYQTYQFPLSNEPVKKASLIHFMGTYRYHNNMYKKIASDAISNMK
ncbi:hypothetical protein [Photobacterium lutimaris]|uniref:Uncharacterized protein n=1 Tax=Photobacterium lutimaris TaxID=388278 RepID=A0A2T3J2Q4_9GAMM|nr:hypothetical protein [Photobacterium lutimaris]PSU35574.1 hypothetical protein C9I99_00700 [Photobacterium lutimaris]TDR78625.1 hypothetical protein DFP78_101137 [Photobacterium lutimaris]